MESPVRTAAKIFHCEKSVLDMGNSIVAHHSLSKSVGSAKFNLINQRSVSSVSRTTSTSGVYTSITSFTLGSVPYYPIIIIELSYTAQITSVDSNRTGEYTISIAKDTANMTTGLSVYSETHRVATTKTLDIRIPMVLVHYDQGTPLFSLINLSNSIVGNSAVLRFNSGYMNITLRNIRLRLYGLTY